MGLLGSLFRIFISCRLRSSFSNFKIRMSSMDVNSPLSIGEVGETCEEGGAFFIVLRNLHLNEEGTTENEGTRKMPLAIKSGKSSWILTGKILKPDRNRNIHSQNFFRNKSLYKNFFGPKNCVFWPYICTKKLSKTEINRNTKICFPEPKLSPVGHPNPQKITYRFQNIWALPRQAFPLKFNRSTRW